MQQKTTALSSSRGAGSEWAFTHLLAVPFTPLIGRESEGAEICTLLRRPSVLLLTLVGTRGGRKNPPGAGGAGGGPRCVSPRGRLRALRSPPQNPTTQTL